MNSIDLNGRVAVVTGGAKGLGAAIVTRLIASGAKVAIWDIDPASLDAAVAHHGDSSAGFRVDVANLDSVNKATADTISRFGQIDILVNNAGISGPNINGWEYPVDEWRQVVEIDLFGVYYCCRAVIPHMISGGYGRIVNIASISGKEGNPTATPYAAAKAGVMAMTKSFGKELVKTGVIINSVAPAAFETDIFKQNTPEFIDYMLSKIPMGRFGRPEELGALVAWLSSEDCSFSTGAVYDISGGRATY
ncbi:SDR family NAD(P)-dependent oxidoreductase [Pseudochelatococcus sp. G4_1912]|jgi:NAD(P)-dependent dehydrogenase (short-subunit alcohol dehydrogenase family)|uniref:SDR family NAD(P)-dependent oxidoreductase n=1 Tax=Pseudochelatococcus sp. G4_1912 TaxID=3114288 RepID=UPI0039C63F42